MCCSTPRRADAIPPTRRFTRSSRSAWWCRRPRKTRSVTVQPGVVLDQLNAYLKPHGLWYPVDVSTSAQATLGGMAGNNSCGSRSIEYGNMVHNVHAIEGMLADGSQFEFGPVPDDLSRLTGANGYVDLVKKVRAIAVRETEEI